MTKTISVSVNENDMRDIDTYCTMHNLTRSKFFVQSALEKVQVEHVANSLILINGLLDKNQNIENLDDEEMHLLKELTEYWAKVGQENG